MCNMASCFCWRRSTPFGSIDVVGRVAQTMVVVGTKYCLESLETAYVVHRAQPWTWNCSAGAVVQAFPCDRRRRRFSEVDRYQPT